MTKASLIISVYKNTVALKAVLDSLAFQTMQDFEIIISEDGNSPEMKTFIDSYYFLHAWKHLSQTDKGWQKNKALNRAIVASESHWLIFIDGDCVLHHRFIEMHVRFASENRILAGKRIKLNEIDSLFLLENTDKIAKFQFQILKRIFKPEGTAFKEEGIFISPDGFWGFIPQMRKLNHLKGCNMSFSKKAILAINGFDENYTLPAVGEDADLSWRFEMAGYKHFSLRNMAVQYHLYHKENWQDQRQNLQYMELCQKAGKYICDNGIIKKSKND